MIARMVKTLGAVLVAAVLTLTASPIAHADDDAPTPTTTYPELPPIPIWSHTDVPPIDALPADVRVHVTHPTCRRTVRRVYVRPAGLGRWRLASRHSHRHAPRDCGTKPSLERSAR